MLYNARSGSAEHFFFWCKLFQGLDVRILTKLPRNRLEIAWIFSSLFTCNSQCFTFLLVAVGIVWRLGIWTRWSDPEACPPFLENSCTPRVTKLMQRWNKLWHWSVIRQRSSVLPKILQQVCKVTNETESCNLLQGPRIYIQGVSEVMVKNVRMKTTH
jgi:hypothetical protein